MLIHIGNNYYNEDLVKIVITGKKCFQDFLLYLQRLQFKFVRKNKSNNVNIELL